jgi:hypothetical protein
MSMGLYLGRSKEDVDYDGEFASFPQDINEYIFDEQYLLPFDVSPLLQIDPFSDTFLTTDQVKKLKVTTENILNCSLLRFDELEYNDLKEVIILLNKAIEKSLGVLVEGD